MLNNNINAKIPNKIFFIISTNQPGTNRKIDRDKMTCKSQNRLFLLKSLETLSFVPLMSSRKTRNTKSNSWIPKAIVGLLLTLLVASGFLRKDPISVVKDIYNFALGRTESITKNDAQWEVFLAEKDKQIATLEQEIKDLKAKGTPPYAIVKTTDTGLNLRSLPSVNSDIVAKIANQEKVDILYIDNENVSLGGLSGNWVKIKTNGTQGFVFSSYLDYVLE